MIAKAAAKKHFAFLIINDNTGKPVGYVDIKSIDWNLPKGELGYFVDEEYAGKGIITKALSCIIRYCFNKLNFIKLFIRTHENNTASKKAAEKNGFIIEGILRQDYKTTGGEIVDMLYYGLIRPQQGSGL